MKMNLGQKIGAGFGSLILIACILGGLAIFNMKNVSTLSIMLDDEYVPEVAVANNIERSSMETMYEMRGYGFTEDRKFLDAGRKNLEAVSKNLREAEELAKKSPNLVKLKGQIENVDNEVQAYVKLVEETEITDEKMDKDRDRLDSSAKQYMTISYDFLAGQNQKMEKDIANNVSNAKLKERLAKITLVNDIIDLGNATRLAAWRSQAERSPELIKDARKNFDVMDTKFAELRKICRSADDIKRIDDTDKASEEYKAAMNELLTNWLHYQDLGQQRNDVGGKVLAAARLTAKAGMDNTQKIANTAVNSLGLASNVMIVGLIFALILGIIIAYFITRSITQPIGKTVHMLEEMAKGHLDSRLRMDRSDEIGQMAKTMDTFADSLQNEMVSALNMLANGDLTFDATPHDEADAIRNSLKKTGDDLNVLISDILTATEQVASGSGQVSESSQALSQGATEQAASLEQITSSMTEMGSQTKLNAENATQANQLASQTRSAAEGGNAKMQEMVAAMGEINEAGQNISKIIKVIDEIAFQTNLLALNAAVEAARAGRHGKGFAVVAEEVRNLAARSAKAAKETAELIEGSVEKTKNGTSIAEATSEALAEIVTSVSKVTDLVGEIAAASNEQAQGINQTNQALGQIDQVTQQNTASAEESAAASEELSGQAMQMKEMMSRFKTRDNGLKRGSAQPSLPSPTQSSPQIGSWDKPSQSTANKPNSAPSDLIALDDKEFGKY
ncbi:MAG: methyl-accepting chemotaxis protein [Desulfobulbaceae bacterium]|nr:methyl-accepting chemotaxis protein [Desulfobulbaceae bacterium]